MTEVQLQEWREALASWAGLSPSRRQAVTDAIAVEARALALADLFVFEQVVLGFRDMTTPLHREVCDVLIAPGRFKLVQLPRQHLKTTVGNIGYALWRIARNPNIRILDATATATNVANWIRLMQTHLLTNPMLRWLFPELIPADLSKVKWMEMAFEVPRTQAHPEATVEGIGVGGTAVSRHYDLIIEDDLVNEDQLIAPEQMRKVIDWHKRCASLFVDPGVGEEVVIGNRWAFDDVIAHIEREEPWFRVYKRAALEDGQAIWPERFTRDLLDQILQRQGPTIFGAQYLNDPQHDDARAFDPSWFRRFTTIPPGPMRYYTAVDPAISQKKSADYTAIVTVGRSVEGLIYVVDARHDRWGVDEFIDALFEVVRTYHPVSVGIESVAFQKVLRFPLWEAMRREAIHFPVCDLKTQNRTKELRIGALAEYFNNGSLFLRTGLTDLDRELREFPSNATHKDLPDALAYAVQMSRNASATAKPEHEAFNALTGILRELRGRQQSTGKDVWTWHGPRAKVSGVLVGKG